MDSQPDTAAATNFQDDTVRLDLAVAETIGAFLERRPQLDIPACLILVTEAILLLEGLYVHLPLKRAMYAVDPVRRLRLLKLRLEGYREQQRRRENGVELEPGEAKAPTNDLWFHREMAETLTSVRDLHTMYVLPEPFDRAVAFVPFQVEDCFEDGRRKYLVSNIVEGLPWFEAPEGFEQGVEITHWNDVPIDRAVELAGMRNAGSNSDARLARGLARLAIRPLAKALPPDEECVTIRYRSGLDTNASTLRVEWRVTLLNPAEGLLRDGVKIGDLAEGLDQEIDLVRTFKKHVYSPLYPRTGFAYSPRRGVKAMAAPEKGVSNIQPVGTSAELRDVLQAKTFWVKGTQYGYIRLRTFKVDDDKLLDEFARLAEAMPENGLIVDIRDNPGGYIQSGERLLQVLSPKRIAPEPAQFINTPLSLAVCEALPQYEEWRVSIRRGVETGTTFSSAYPLSVVEFCNNVGQRYYGPCTLITNGLCYSTADIFAAGFQDHKIGSVLGTDGRTGAGGANVLTHSQLRDMVKAARGDAPSGQALPLQDLPAGDLRFAIRRTLRVGERSNTELEDLGVIPDIPYQISRNDLFHDNVDMICKATESFAGKPIYRLREAGHLTVDRAAVVVEIETKNLSRLDATIDGWASCSRTVSDGTKLLTFDLPPSGTRNTLELRGFDQDFPSPAAAYRKIWLS